MRINAIDNTMFQARIKMKPATKKLIGGAATATAGLASIYTGLNASDLIPGDFTQNVYESIKNEHIIEANDGYAMVDNGGSALTAYSSMYSSLPLGSIGIVKGVNDISKGSKKIPD